MPNFEKPKLDYLSSFHKQQFSFDQRDRFDSFDNLEQTIGPNLLTIRPENNKNENYKKFPVFIIPSLT